MSTFRNPSTHISQMTGRYTEGAKSMLNSSLNRTQFYDNSMASVRDNRSFKMMPGKKKRKENSFIGSKQIVLNPHCKDNQEQMDYKIQRIKEIKETL